MCSKESNPWMRTTKIAGMCALAKETAYAQQVHTPLLSTQQNEEKGKRNKIASAFFGKNYMQLMLHAICGGPIGQPSASTFIMTIRV